MTIRFDHSLCHSRPLTSLPNFNATRALPKASFYSVITNPANPQEKQLLHIEESLRRFEKAPFQWTKNLKEISAFVAEALKQGADAQRVSGQEGHNFSSPFEQMGFGGRVCLYLNLKQISTYIDRHNDRVQTSFWIKVIDIILLVFSLGIFSYKDHLLIENFALSLEQVTQGESLAPYQRGEVSSIPLNLIVAMPKADRDFLCKKLSGENSSSLGSNLEEKPVETSLDKISFLSPEALSRFTMEDLDALVRCCDAWPLDRCQSYVMTGQEDEMVCTVLFGRLVAHEPNISMQALEGGVEEWRNLPFDQFRRLTPQQLTIYCDAYPSGTIPSFIRLLPWSLRKHVLETSVNLLDRQGRFHYDHFRVLLDSSWRGPPSPRLLSLIAELSYKGQCKVPDPFLLPRSFFERFDWIGADDDSFRFYLERASEHLFDSLSLSFVKAILDRCYANCQSVTVMQQIQEPVNGQWITREVPVQVGVNSDSFSVGRCFSAGTLGKIGLSWFLETPQRGFALHDLLQIVGPGSFATLSVSSDQLVQILQSEQLRRLNYYFSPANWDQIPAGEIMQLGGEEISRCMELCSDWKLLELVKHAQDQQKDLSDHIPPLRACNLSSLEPFLSEKVKQHNKWIQEGKAFLEKHKALTNDQLAREIQKERRNEERYEFFWMGLEERVCVKQTVQRWIDVPSGSEYEKQLISEEVTVPLREFSWLQPSLQPNCY